MRWRPCDASCSHVFCEKCLQDWLDRSKQVDAEAAATTGAAPTPPRCPTCNTSLGPNQAGP